MSTEDQFRNAIIASGIQPPDEIIADGEIHRFSTNGKRSDKSGWYALHEDNVPAGAFGDWRMGVEHTWRANTGRKLSTKENAEYAARISEIRRKREKEDLRRHADAAKKANALLSESSPAAEDHPYLAMKGVKPHGLRELDGELLVPMLNREGIQSLQRIFADGEKRFLPGGRVSGCYYPIGNTEGAKALCIAEGFATAASIHEATGYPVAVAFNAGNLLAVAHTMRERFPDLPLILCADDDHQTPGNPGMTKAKEAAAAVGGKVAVPVFGDGRPEKATDFNDLAKLRGLDVVRSIIDDALRRNEETRVAAAAGVTASIAAESGFRVMEEEEHRDGRVLCPGVWFLEESRGTWISSPIYVDAMTADENRNNFGRLLRFKTSFGDWRTWAMPMEMLAGDCTPLREELLSMGAEIATTQKARGLLTMYLQSMKPARTVHCATQTGWSRGVFVLPNAVIGEGAANVVHQSGERAHEDFSTSGTLEGWREGVAKYAVGNPILTLAISAAFAGPMLMPCEAESGGVHLVGDSSTGKTSAIEAARSVWGGPSLRRSWRATANGLEGVATLFNDCLLVLDEISEANPLEIGAIVYALGNGIGKQRASRSGAARKINRWRSIILSSGERTIETSMAEGRQYIKAGQAVRMIDVPVYRKHGAWDDLHGHESGAAFSDEIRSAAREHYGHAGRAFLERLTRAPKDGRTSMRLTEKSKAFAFDDLTGQERRVLTRFVLLGLAGEVATRYGITGWPENEAINAAATCFNAWRDSRVHASGDERQQIERKLVDFIQRHGDSRFSNIKAEPVQIKDRAGWWEDDQEGRVYLFSGAGLREALKEHDFGRALEVLVDMEVIPKPGPDGRRARLYRVDNRPMRLYPVATSKLGD